MAFCVKCGEKLDDKSAFCVKCGAPVAGKKKTGAITLGGDNNSKTGMIVIGVVALIALIIIIKIFGAIGNKIKSAKNAKTSDTEVSQDESESSGNSVEDLLASFEGEYKDAVQASGTTLMVSSAGKDSKQYGYVVAEENAFGSMSQVQKVHVSKRGIDFSNNGKKEDFYFLSDNLDYEKTENGEDCFVVKDSPNLRFVFYVDDFEGTDIQYLIPQIYVGSDSGKYVGKVATGDNDYTDGVGGFMFTVQSASPGPDGWASFEYKAYGKVIE